MNDKVFVYWNSHKKCFSVKKKGYKVLHKNNIKLNNVECFVGKGREKVIKNCVKNVHAGLKGFICNDKKSSSNMKEIKYNPFKNKTFVYKSNGKPVFKAQEAVMKVKNGRPLVLIKK